MVIFTHLPPPVMIDSTAVREAGPVPVEVLSYGAQLDDQVA